MSCDPQPLCREKEKSMIAEDIKRTIDAMSYWELLERVRFAPPGDPYFVGEVGTYFMKRTAEKRDEDPERAVAVSKALGWEKR